MLEALKSIFRSKPKQLVKIQHPRLGEIRYEDEFWVGAVVCSDKTIEVSVAGDMAGPNPQVVDRLERSLTEFKSIEHQTLEFLREKTKDNPSIDPRKFSIQSLDFLCPERENYFMIYLQKEGDEYGLWKVEFIDGQPKYLSRDS